MSMPTLLSSERSFPLSKLLPVLLFPLFMALAYPGSYMSAMHHPVPQKLNIEVVGTSPASGQVAQKLAIGQGIGGHEALDVTTVPDLKTAQQDVRELRVRAAYDPARGDLYVASASGLQATRQAQTMVQQVAATSGKSVTVHDLQPVTAKDSSGISFMYMLTAAVITGYITATILGLLGGNLKLHWQLLIQAVLAVAAGVILPAIDYGLYGVYSGHILEVMGICGGVFMAVSVFQLGLARSLGMLATPIGILLFVILGVPSAGIAQTPDLLPGFFNVMHRLLPSGAGAELLRRNLYFDGAGSAPWILQLLSWFLVGLGLLWVSTLRNPKHIEESSAGLISDGLEHARNHPDEPLFTAFHDPEPTAHEVGADQTLSGTAPQEPTSTASAPADAQSPAQPAALPSLSRLRDGFRTAPSASALGTLPAPAPGRPVNAVLTRNRMLTAGLLFPLFLLVVMPTLMTGTVSGLAPREMPVALIGTAPQVTTMANQLETNSAGKFDVKTVTSVAEARAEIADHTIRAAYDPATVTLYTAGANGGQVNGAVNALFTPVAQQASKTLKKVDTAPLATEDSIGSTATNLGLGAIVGGLMTGLLLGLLPVNSRTRITVGLVMPAVIATAMVLYGWAIFGIFSGSAHVTWGILYLLCLTCVTVTTGLLLSFGPAALPLAILLLPLLGTSTSGVAAPLDMVNTFYSKMHDWIFSAQGLWAIRDTLYFPAASLDKPVAVMATWFVVGLALAILGTLRQKRRHLFNTIRAEKEAQAAVAIGAAVL